MASSLEEEYKKSYETSPSIISCILKKTAPVAKKLSDPDSNSKEFVNRLLVKITYNSDRTNQESKFDLMILFIKSNEEIKLPTRSKLVLWCGNSKEGNNELKKQDLLSDFHMKARDRITSHNIKRVIVLDTVNNPDDKLFSIPQKDKKTTIGLKRDIPAVVTNHKKRKKKKGVGVFKGEGS